MKADEGVLRVPSAHARATALIITSPIPGLIPVASDQAAAATMSANHANPVSPMNTGNNRVSDYSSAPSELTSYTPAPPYGQAIHENKQPSDPIAAPEPVKAYPGQPDIQSQYPVHSPSDVKAYPGQPAPPQQGPHPYYTPFGQPSSYATAVPLHSLQSAPAPVDCPSCGHREMTRVESVSGGTIHAWAAIACCLCCLGCIPYLINSLKDVEHSCGRCSVKLARWHNSGRIQIFQSQVLPPDPNRQMRQAHPTQ